MSGAYPAGRRAARAASGPTVREAPIRAVGVRTRLCEKPARSGFLETAGTKHGGERAVANHLLPKTALRRVARKTMLGASSRLQGAPIVFIVPAARGRCERKLEG